MDNHRTDHQQTPGGGHVRDRAADLLFCLLVVFVLAWFWLPATRAQGSSPHDALFYFGILPGLLLAALRAPWRTLLRNPVVVASLVFIGYLSLSVAWSRPPVELDPGRVALFGISTAAFVLAITVLANDRRLAVFSIAVVIAATSATVVAMVQLVRGFGYPVDRLSSAIHFEHPNLFAHYLGFAALVAVGAAFRSDRIWSRWAWLGSGMVLTVGVLLTRGRTVTAVLILCLLASASLYLGRRAAALLAVAVMVSGVIMSASLDGHLNAFVLRGDAGRDFIYRSLVERLGDHWVIGAGIAADDDVHFEKVSQVFPRGITIHHPHSAFVATFYYGGVLGITLLFTVLALAVSAGVSAGRHTGEWDPLLLLGFGIACLITDGQRLVSNPHLSSWLLLWLPVGLIASSLARTSHQLLTAAGEALHFSGLTTKPGEKCVPARIGPQNRRGEPHRRTAQELSSVAPGPRSMTVVFAALVGLGWLWSPSSFSFDHLESWFLIAVSAAGLFLLLSRVIGRAAAGVASLVYVSAPIFAAPSFLQQTSLLGLAAVLIGAGLWLRGIDRGSATERWFGVAAMAAAGLFDPAVALSMAPPVWWWTRTRGVSLLTLSPIAAVWILGWILLPGIGEPLLDGGLVNPSLLSLALGLSVAHLVTVLIVGLAGVVPAVVGALLATAPERRWLLWWFIGSWAGMLLLMDPSAPGGREMITILAPAAIAITLGLLWLGRELVHIDLSPDVGVPDEIDEKRQQMARLLVMAFLLLVVATRGWSVWTGGPP